MGAFLHPRKVARNQVTSVVAGRIKVIKMGNFDCPFHSDHENRLKRLEKDMEEVDKHIKSSNITVAVISTVGVVVTALSSVAGVVITSYAKSKGYF